MFTSNLKNSVSFSSIILPSHTHTHTLSLVLTSLSSSFLPFNCVNTDCGRKKRVCKRSFALRPKLSLSFILHAISATFTRRRLCYGASWTVAGSIKTPFESLYWLRGAALVFLKYSEGSNCFWNTLTRNKSKSSSRQKKRVLVECAVMGTGLNICFHFLHKMETSHYL